MGSARSGRCLLQVRMFTSAPDCRGRHPGGVALARVLPLALALWVTLGMLVGCRAPVPGALHLYDLSGTNVMQCSFISPAAKSNTKGILRCLSPDGEKFQGQWMTMVATAPRPTGSYWSSIPSIPNNPLAATWGWAASFGVNMENYSGNYGVFLLYGNKGTVVDGMFLFKGNATGYLGAATDNKGRRYKVMG